jgi:DNA polymerase sigma
MMREILDDFVKYAKESFGYDIAFVKSSSPDTFESLFKESFLKQQNEELFFCDESDKNMSYTNISVNIVNCEGCFSRDFELDQELVFAA